MSCRSVAALVALMRMPLAPPETSCRMFSACFWASSETGVRQSTRISTPYFFDSSRAASSAPCRAALKTSLVWLLAIMPMT